MKYSYCPYMMVKILTACILVWKRFGKISSEKLAIHNLFYFE